MSWKGTDLLFDFFYVDKGVVNCMISDYIDEKLIGSGTIDKAAIFSATEYSPWAASAGFKARLARSAILKL